MLQQTVPANERKNVASTKQIIDRIVADNDPRNGTIAERLIRMSEQPDRQPNADGLYEPRPLSRLDQELAAGGYTGGESRSNRF